jgi:hypothetical protein
MPLTKAQIIEIQESAKHNVLKRLREQEEKAKFEKDVAEKIAEQTGKKPVEVDSKKGK